MAKPKETEAWGRATARKRYAEGGEVEVNMSENGAPVEQESESPLEPPAADRTAEIDEFISRVMRDQIKKMGSD